MLARLALIRAGQQINQALGLSSIGAVSWSRLPYTSSRARSPAAASRTAPRPGADDLGRLRAADRPQRVAFQQVPRIAVAPFGKILSRCRDLVGDAELSQNFRDVNARGRRSSYPERRSRRPRATRRAGVAASAIATGGSPARTASAVSTRPISGSKRERPVLFRKLGDDRRRQHHDVGRRALAQFVGHGADRAELALDIEAGLCLEFWREARDQSLRRAAAQNVQRVHDANSIAAIRLSRVIGRSRTRTPSASNTALAIAAVTGPWAASPAPTGSISGRWISSTSHLRHLAEAKDRIIGPAVAGDALPVEANALLQHPAGGLDRAAFDLVDHAVRD